MSGRTYSYAVTLIGVVCVYVLVRTVLNVDSLTLRNDLVQGLLTGFGLGVVAVEVLARLKATRVNGWTTIYGAGLPTSGILTRAAAARIFPGPVNVPEEAMYWKTRVDARGHPLTGADDYVLHFPPGGLPPIDAFW